MKVPLVIKVQRPQFWFAVLLRYPNESTASPNLVGGTIGGTLGSNSVAVVKACIVMKCFYTITSYPFDEKCYPYFGRLGESIIRLGNKPWSTFWICPLSNCTPF